MLHQCHLPVWMGTICDIFSIICTTDIDPQKSENFTHTYMHGQLCLFCKKEIAVAAYPFLWNGTRNILSYCMISNFHSAVYPSTDLYSCRIKVFSLYIKNEGVASLKSNDKNKVL